jgi:hypothetical protein
MVRRYGFVIPPASDGAAVAVKSAARRMKIAGASKVCPNRVNLYAPAQGISVWAEVLPGEDGRAAAEVAMQLFAAAITAAKPESPS